MPEDPKAAPLLEVRHLCKQFPGVRALHQVSLSLQPGEVLAVIGENGAGKSTLMKILAGIQAADRGEILLEGQAVDIASVRRATELGVALIHQELNLADNLDVGANVFLGREPRRFGFIDKVAIARQSADVIRRVGLRCSPKTLVRDLSIGHQQLVEIAKALSANARILIMDEPTSSLSQGETEQLYRVIRDLQAQGVSIIYISHRLGEVKELASRVTVLRDGENAGELAREEINHDNMVRLMVGRENIGGRHRVTADRGKVLLEVEGLETAAHRGKALNFRVHAGEIVGVAGLVGAGRTEILDALFGVTPPHAGTVRIEGEALRLRSARDAIRAGMGLVPEDRKLSGLVIEMAVRENLSLASLWRDQRRGLLNRAREAAISTEMIQKLNIRTPSERQIVRLLSGGNQQKVVIGKWLAMQPRVLLLDEPTRGIDVGAKQEIYDLMEQLAAEGVGILFVSSEMEEILRMSDRTLVVHEGRIAGELPRAELSEEAVMKLATGSVAAA